MSGDWTVLDWFVSLTLVTWWQCGVYTPFLFNVQQAWSVVLQLVRCYCAPCSCWRPPCCLFFPGPVTQWVFFKLYLRWDNYEWTPCNWELSLHCCSKVHLPIDGVKLVLYIHEQPLGLLARAWVNVWWSVIFLSGCRRNNPPKHNWVFSWTKSLLALCSALCSSDITVPAAVQTPVDHQKVLQPDDVSPSMETRTFMTLAEDDSVCAVVGRHWTVKPWWGPHLFIFIWMIYFPQKHKRTKPSKLLLSNLW